MVIYFMLVAFGLALIRQIQRIVKIKIHTRKTHRDVMRTVTICVFVGALTFHLCSSMLEYAVGALGVAFVATDLFKFGIATRGVFSTGVPKGSVAWKDMKEAHVFYRQAIKMLIILPNNTRFEEFYDLKQLAEIRAHLDQNNVPYQLHDQREPTTEA